MVADPFKSEDAQLVGVQLLIVAVVGCQEQRALL